MVCLLYYNQLVKKIWCVIIAPTLRNTLTISFAFGFTKEHFFYDLKPLGWIHTKPNKHRPFSKKGATQLSLEFGSKLKGSHYVQGHFHIWRAL